MRILITGSAGYLGRHLVQECLERKDEVIGLDLKASGLAHLNYRECHCDITHQEEVRKIVSSTRPDIIMHLAAALAQFVRNKTRLHQINVEGTRNLIAAAFEAEVKQFLFASSVEVYGVDVPVPCPETAPLNPVCQYGRDKVECEQMCREYFQKGLNTTIFRPPTITGPGQNEPTLLGHLKNAYLDKPILLPGGGKTRLQMVNVKDVCRAFLLAIGNPKAHGSVMNLGSDNVPTFRELLVALFQHAGKVPKFINLNPSLARFLVKLLSIFHLSPVEPQHLEIALRDYVFDTTKAKELLGWTPSKSDIESIRDSYDWYVREVLSRRQTSK